MEEPSTDTLRKLAPCWTLAGDERLLTILQNTHQRLVAKCQETNSQLDQMTTALDDASITLQNVNNQFMALSSSQFIESRVYDDDIDIVTDEPTIKEPQKPLPPDEISILKRSLEVIESTHEVITILHDSDTESDSDDELHDRLVMKPKDLYADRPLPYIIGSEPWKNKWHAGLLPEDSDSDSSTSKVDRDSDQYSQSEPEEFDAVHPAKVQETSLPGQHVRRLSETSSEVPSEVTPTPKPTPSDVASEIARRLGAGLPPPKMADPEPEYQEPSKPTIRKVYKPQEPITSTIFSDEPPPLEAGSEEDEEGDIFAELHRQQPYSEPYTRQSIADELFGDDRDDGADIFRDLAPQPNTKPTSIFDAGPTPHMFDKQNTSAGHQTNTLEPAVEHITKNAGGQDEEKVKKPIGGISLFGSNKGTESIGAAILKRNQRKSSTSGEESGNDVTEPPVKEQAKKEKDIFDDLFAKTESKKVKPKVDSIGKSIKQHIEEKHEVKAKKDTPKAVDIFSDNLFDDIDDIFTTNVVKTAKDDKKSIFEDDDDLFSEIAEPKTLKHEVKSSADVKKSLFDSDDDLFSDVAKPSISGKPDSVTKLSENSKVDEKSTKTTLFDDDDDNIFSNTKTNNVTKVQNVTLTGDNLVKNVETSKNIFKSPSLFDEDDESDDIFAETIKVNTHKSEIEKLSTETPNKLEVEERSAINDEIKHSDNIAKEIDTEAEVGNTKETVVSEITSSANKTIENNDNDKSNIKTLHDKVLDNNTNINNESEIDIPQVANTLNPTSTAINKMLEDTTKTSDEDFSEQDFDDETIDTPKSNLNKDSNVPDTKTNIQSIFDNLADDDIFASPNIPTEDNIDINTTKTELFTDIVTEPPEFEKPKEPKKSKNVNALFDDDSDDEALFFKKDDVISDEKPEDFTIKQDTLFGLFTDEPPDDGADDLFNTMPISKLPDDRSKSNKNETNTKNILENVTIDEDNTVTEITEKPVTQTKVVFKIPITDTTLPKDTGNSVFREKQSSLDTNLSDDDEELFKSLPAQLPTQEITKNDDSDEELFKSLPIFEKLEPKDVPKSASNTDIYKAPSKSEPKKLGKLQLGLNINVNALLPGASPKKVKQIDSPDGQVPSVETKVEDTVKTVSFDGQPEVLDNKLSKERPRIQVKRRPSTRKARREAVRKSGIDFGDDSTDNSSSIDDTHTKTQPEIAKTEEKHEIAEPKAIESDDNVAEVPVQAETIQAARAPIKSDSTTKIVYILNDEDIFNTNVIETPGNNTTVAKTEVLDSNLGKNLDTIRSDLVKDVNKDIFSTNAQTNQGISTIGKVYQAKSEELKKTTASIFGEDENSDEELFKSKTKVKKASIFDSDSDGELFGTVKKVEKVEKSEKLDKVEKLEKVKKSLFDDDDDDDDLFGVKAKKTDDPQPQPRTSSNIKESAKPAQPVFEDPLSMFGDDD